MSEVGTVVAIIAMAFAFSTFWYEALRRPQADRFRPVAFALAGIFIGEGLVSGGLVGGPAVLGLHPVVSLLGSFIAIYLDVAWQERKVWPWEIIGDLRSFKNPVRTLPKVRFSVGEDEEEEDFDKRQAV